MRSRIVTLVSSLLLLLVIPPGVTACWLVGCPEDPDCERFGGSVDKDSCTCIGRSHPAVAPVDPNGCASDSQCHGTSCQDGTCSDACITDAACRKDATCDARIGVCETDGGAAGRACTTNADCHELGAYCDGTKCVAR